MIFAYVRTIGGKSEVVLSPREVAPRPPGLRFVAVAADEKSLAAKVLLLHATLPRRPSFVKKVLDAAAVLRFFGQAVPARFSRREF